LYDILVNVNKLIMSFFYPEYHKNKMLLLILSSMYDQYREGYGASWF
jgi:hypothetical protein